MVYKELCACTHPHTCPGNTCTHTDQHQNGIYFWSIIDAGSLGRVKAFLQGSCAAELNLSIPRLKTINTLKCLPKSLNRHRLNDGISTNSYKTQQNSAMNSAGIS